MKNREIIIRRALRLFRKHGIKSMSVERLTRELKLSRRALYSLFGDKEGLLAACLDLNYREEIEEFNRIRQQGNDPIEVFILAGQRVIEREFSLSPNFYHDILYYYPDLRDKAIKLQDNFNRKQLTGLFEEGKQQGLFLEDTDEALWPRHSSSCMKAFSGTAYTRSFTIPKPSFSTKRYTPTSEDSVRNGGVSGWNIIQNCF